MKYLKNILLVCSLFFISLATSVYAEDTIYVEGEVYSDEQGEYIDMAGKTYGPYIKIDNVIKTENNWGFKYVTESKEEYPDWNYYYVVNGKEYGPYWSIKKSGTTYLDNRYKLVITENHYGFICRDYGENLYRFHYDGKEVKSCLGRSESEPNFFITENNYGFACYPENGDSYAYINGNIYSQKEDEYQYGPYKFKVGENNWGYISKKETSGSCLSNDSEKNNWQVRINGDKFGPYDNIRQFTIEDNNWAFGYEKNGEYFILSNNRTPYKLPLKKSDIESYNEGIFHPSAEDPNMGQWHGPHSTGDDTLKVFDDGWKLRYLIDGEFVEFSAFAGENVKQNTINTLYGKLKGKIILKVEDKGEAYYILPTTNKIYYLGRPSSAFNIMREQGLGVSEKDFDSFNGYAPESLSGKILLRVEANGEAYYVNPVDLKIYYLGRPTDAFNIMRNLGLGISSNDYNNLRKLVTLSGVGMYDMPPLKE